ncbi:MAG: transglutaminase domain-containing protein [bacterium]|nr:transglutaminase domain-containing protein [bacterium]
MLNSVSKKILVYLVIFQFIFSPLAPALAEELSETLTQPPVEAVLPNIVPDEKSVVEQSSSPPAADTNEPKIETKAESKKPTPSYASVMRKVSAVRSGKITSDTEKQQIADELTSLIDSEEDRLDNLDGGWVKEMAYADLLKKQLAFVQGEKPSFVDKVIDGVKDVIGLNKQNISIPEDGFTMPKDPSSFKFNDEPVVVETIQEVKTGNIPAKFNLTDELKKVITIEEVSATDGQMPVLGDIQSDGEATVTSEISQLADSLNRNPVKIFNFVRNNIVYEPYFGAKKGSIGCLEERVCNDTDAASLTVALLRASGIPAHYKKGLAVMTVQQLQKLLGVDETKTVYAALYWNKIPVHILSDLPVNTNFDNMDFTTETHLGLEWTVAEAFVEYDERGGNIDSHLDLAGIATTEALRTTLGENQKRQWIPIDPVVKPYTHLKREVVPVTVGFDAENFWTGFLSYQGDLSPADKYTADLLQATGKSVANDAYQSYKTPIKKDFQILPPTLPYIFGEGDATNGTQINFETWSALPDERRNSVKVILKKGDDTVLEHTFFGSEINNQGVNLFYEGATDDDKQIIESYGGIAATPAALVAIKPFLETDFGTFNTDTNLYIGDQLTLRTEYYVKNIALFSDGMFSVAGNNLGMYFTLSRIQDDHNLDTNSKILMAGNTAIAREYLKHIVEKGDLLARSLDHQYNIGYSRAVVTQNRVLSAVDGVPTTFDFKGLSVDASAYINDYSGRGNYKDHWKDFRLLWELESSYYEAQLFTDVAGLDGISTVKGLQYAYGRPGEYTVHTITAENESVIDTLDVSGNTKANMHADVQAGNTVITPDKSITYGAWTGQLYISLEPNWLGTYAIGEQVGMNGGWTVNQYTLTDWQDSDSKPQLAYQYIKGPQQFIYKDNPEKNVLCSISVAAYNNIVGGNYAPGWNMASFGQPCMGVEEYHFGDHDHIFVLSTNGAYFKSVSDGYDYWINDKSIRDKFYFKFPGSYNGFGRLSPYWGTIVNDDSSNDRILVLSPRTNDVYSISNEMYERYISGQTILGIFIPGLLGYPTSDKSSAAVYTADKTKGFYQQFANGTLYQVDDWFSDSVYPVIGKINEKHNELGGSSVVGFPIIDPTQSGQGQSAYFQNFQDGQKLRYNGNLVEIADASQTLSILRDYENEEYDELMEGIQDGFAELDVYGLTTNFAAGVASAEVVKHFGKTLAKRAGKKAALKVGVRFVPFVGLVFTGVTASLAVFENKPLYAACNSDPEARIEGKRPAYYCGRLAVNGFAFGIGIAVDIIGGKLNNLGVGSKIAQEAKSKTISLAANDAEWFILKKNSLLAGKTRTSFYERIGKLNLNDDEIRTIIKNEKAIKLLFSDKYYGWTNDITIYRNGTLKTLPSSLVNKFVLSESNNAVEHILIGEYHIATGLYEGSGLHNVKILKKAMDNGVVEVFDAMNESIRYGRFEDIPQVNGIRQVKILQRNGQFSTKSMFPDNWTEEDILSAIVEASTQRVGDTFTKVVSRRGFTIPVSGYFDENLANLISTGFAGELF